MNEVLIIGIMAVLFLIMGVIGAVIENIGDVCRYIRCAVSVIGSRVKARYISVYEWLFDVQSAYYKWKQRR